MRFLLVAQTHMLWATELIVKSKESCYKCNDPERTVMNIVAIGCLTRSQCIVDIRSGPAEMFGESGRGPHPSPRDGGSNPSHQNVIDLTLAIRMW